MNASSESTSQQGSLPPANPAYVLRGHTSPIHALTFFSRNRYLISGDADGWLVVWSTTSKRASAVWKAHQGSLMGLREWALRKSEGMVVSHGRDHKLRVWQLRDHDLESLDNRLPTEDAEMQKNAPPRRAPWLLYALDVNALNFCAFGMCYDESPLFAPNNSGKQKADKASRTADLTDNPTSSTSISLTSSSIPSSKPNPILLATANALESGGIDIFHLPSSRRISTIPVPGSLNTGMLMAVDLAFIHPNPNSEDVNEKRTADTERLAVAAGYESGHVCIHIRQLALSSPSISGQDVTRHWQTTYTSRPHSQPVLSLSIDPSPSHGWCISSSADAVIAKHPFQQQYQQCEPPPQPLKTINTKHAGQQGLAVRDDGKVLATAGWDKRVRIYGAKGLKELAVLKWHREGCYAVAFAEVLPFVDADGAGDKKENGSTITSGEEKKEGGEASALARIRDARAQKAQRTHWLVAGGKDGKISMWEVY